MNEADQCLTGDYLCWGTRVERKRRDAGGWFLCPGHTYMARNSLTDSVGLRFSMALSGMVIGGMERCFLDAMNSVRMGMDGCTPLQRRKEKEKRGEKGSW
jgi:hypothetical protein